MINDLRFAIRSLSRSKLFALTALAAFSFGIAACTIVFSILDAVVLRPATFPDAASVVRIEASEDKGEWGPVPAWIFDRAQTRRDLFSEVTAARTALFTVTQVPNPDEVFGLSVSGQFFEMLHGRAWRGRVLLPEDDRPGAARVALLSYRGWQQIFNSDARAVGKTAQIDGDLYTLIGIMPSDFVMPGPNGGGMLWTALRLSPAEISSRDARPVNVMARLRRSASIRRAQAVLDAIARTGLAPEGGKPWRLRASLWRPDAEKEHRLILWLAMGMVSGLLLIACANLASLLLARAIARRRDYAIRLATGASRMQVMRQSLMEVGVLALGGLLIAGLASSIALQFVRNHLGSVQMNVPNLARIQLNGYTLLFSFAVTCLAALACGLFPALSATSIDLATGLREMGAQIASGKSARRFLRSILVIEAAVSMILLLTSGLLIRSLIRLVSDDHGLQPDRVLTLRLPTGSWQKLPPNRSDEDRKRQIRRYLDMLRQAESIRGVEAAAVASSLPLSNTVVRTHLFRPHPSTSGESSEIMPVAQAVSRDYFRVMGIPLLSGRTFEAQDAGSKLYFALVNEAFARAYFDGENPVGKFVQQPESKQPAQIIGVVKNSPHLDFSETVEPEIYFNFEQSLMTPFLTGLAVRSHGDPQSISNALRTALSLEDADQAVVHVRTLRSLVDQNIWRPRFSAWLFSVFAAIALSLCAIGIYGVVSYITTAQRRDFGIRASLGADSAGLFHLAAVQNLAPVIAGVAFGAVGSFWTSRWIASLLYKAESFDPFATVGSAAILILAAFFATAVPAIRSARVDPAIILRSE